MVSTHCKMALLLWLLGERAWPLDMAEVLWRPLGRGTASLHDFQGLHCNPSSNQLCMGGFWFLHILANFFLFFFLSLPLSLPPSFLSLFFPSFLLSFLPISFFLPPAPSLLPCFLSLFFLSFLLSFLSFFIIVKLVEGTVSYPHFDLHFPNYRGLECKSRKSRNTWSNRQIWPWNMEWSRAKTNRVLSRKCTGHNKHPLPTTQEKTLYMDITRW